LKITLDSRLSGLFCVFTLLVCALAAYPVAEIGIQDDFSFLKSAQVYMQTGHFVYNGWATPIQGWQLLLGALFAKVFGPSFTAIRASTLLISLAIAYLTQRTLVRAGVSPRNSVIGTLAFVLSPLFLPLSVGFMTDIGGLFCIALCVYTCLRALQADSDRAVLGWLVFAAVSNALLGTVRQIPWLGVLVMFPCTVWMLRRRPGVVVTGAVLYLGCAAFIRSVVQWFYSQPYSVPEPMFSNEYTLHSLKTIVSQPTRGLFTIVMLLLPILIAFVPAISWRVRSTQAIFAVGGVLCLAGGLFLNYRHKLIALLAPFSISYLSEHGLMDGNGIKGDRPVILTPEVRLFLTAVVFLALMAFLAFLLEIRKHPPLQHVGSNALSMKSALILLAPFSLAYIAMLLPRAAAGHHVFDRYLLPLIFVGLILVLLLYQSRVEAKLPMASVAAVVLFAACAVAGTHDGFSMYRARVAAIEEVRAAGVPDTAIDGGFEHNGLTQIELRGSMNDPRIRIPANLYVPFQSPLPAYCQPEQADLTPVIAPRYTLSFNPAACGGPTQFAPVTYRAWLGPHAVSIYIVNSSAVAGSADH
jgi:hypothetical protein